MDKLFDLIKVYDDALEPEICEKLIEKFHMFKCKYVDYYDSSFRNEGSEFRWTFTGTKE